MVVCESATAIISTSSSGKLELRAKAGVAAGDVKLTDGAIVNDPDFSQRVDHRSYGVGITQVLTRNMILSLNYQALTDQGYLQSPYRFALYLDPTSPSGFSG